jgi:two-component system response regulator RegX3
VWGAPAQIGDPERLFAHIRRIRKKIEPAPSHPAFLLTVRGEGFRLADPPPTTS